MKLVLTRKWFTASSSVGELSVDGVFECFTLEDAARALGVKLKGITCIPSGEYSVIITYSNRFAKDMPLIYNHMVDFSVMDGFGAKWEGIRIHSGNTDADTDGCVLVGRKKSLAAVSESRPAYASLFEKIKEALRTDRVSLTVQNKQEKL